MNYKSMDDWYNVTTERIHKNGGGGLLSTYYNNSPSSALQNIYPQHNWELEKFKKKFSKMFSKYNSSMISFLGNNTTHVEF